MSRQSGSKLAVSVVVPLFDEEENVALLYEELCAVLRQLPNEYEIIFVDDGSRDATWATLTTLTDDDARVTSVRFARNYGQTAAIQAGFDRATGDAVITMDGDLQNDPADIPILLAELETGVDVVSGWRKDRKDRYVTRRVPSVLANWLIGTITGVHIHDNGCTLKAYRSDLVKRAHLYADMHRFLAPMLSLSGCKYREIVVNHRPRRFGRTKYGLSRVWKVFLDLLAIKMILRFIAHPATWFALLSFPFGLATIAAGSLSLYLYAASQDQELAIVAPSITLLFSFTFANLLTVGMLGELIVRVGDYSETDPIIASVESTREP